MSRVLRKDAMQDLNFSSATAPALGFFTGVAFSVEISKFTTTPIIFYVNISVCVCVEYAILVIIYRNWFVPADRSSGSQAYKQGALHTQFTKVLKTSFFYLCDCIYMSTICRKFYTTCYIGLNLNLMFVLMLAVSRSNFKISSVSI